MGAAALLEAGPWRPGWLLFKENRLAEGDAYPAFGVQPGAAGLLLAVWLAVALVALLPGRRRAWLLALLASAALVVTMLMVGGAAREMTAGASQAARVSVLGGVWLTLLACFVVTFGALNEAPPHKWTRLLIVGIGPFVAALLVFGGALNDLGLARELASQGSDFRAELARHLALAGTSLLVAALVAVPAAVVAARRPGVARWVLPGTGLVQTLPSLALFGLLVSPLAQLGRHVTVSGASRVALVGLMALLTLRALDRSRKRRSNGGEPLVTALRGLLTVLPIAPGALMAVVLAVVLHGVMAALLGGGTLPGWPGGDAPLAELGVRGIGSAPALIALTLYALLPIVRNTYTGITGVPRAAIDAGVGMGMSAGQLLWRVQFPLALPLVIEGLRAAAVLTIGTTTVAYLIGAGGLGVFIQRGIDQVVPDLVLVGAIPIILLALVADALLRGLGRAITPRGVKEPAATSRSALVS